MSSPKFYAETQAALRKATEPVPEPALAPIVFSPEVRFYRLRSALGKAETRFKFHEGMRLEAAKTMQVLLEFLLATMRDESKPQEIRFEAAEIAAPYFHAPIKAHTKGDAK